MDQTSVSYARAQSPERFCPPLSHIAYIDIIRCFEVLKIYIPVPYTRYIHILYIYYYIVYVQKRSNQEHHEGAAGAQACGSPSGRRAP